VELDTAESREEAQPEPPHTACTNRTRGDGGGETIVCAAHWGQIRESKGVVTRMDVKKKKEGKTEGTGN
jgi:hypothetical protein